MEVGSLIGNPPVFPSKMESCTLPVLGAFTLRRMSAIGTFNRIKTAFEKLWGFIVIIVRPGEIPFQSKVKPRAVTRRRLT